MSSEKKTFLSTFEITDRESCEKAIRNGGAAGLISAVIALGFGFVGLLAQSSGSGFAASDARLSYLLDPGIFVDIALIVVLSAFVFRKSRIASTLLLVHLVISKIVMWTELGAPKGAEVFLTIIYLLYYVTAMRGTYIWHSKYRDAAVEGAARHGHEGDARDARA